MFETLGQLSQGFFAGSLLVLLAALLLIPLAYPLGMVLGLIAELAKLLWGWINFFRGKSVAND